MALPEETGVQSQPVRLAQPEATGPKGACAQLPLGAAWGSSVLPEPPGRRAVSACPGEPQVERPGALSLADIERIAGEASMSGSLIADGSPVTSAARAASQDGQIELT